MKRIAFAFLFAVLLSASAFAEAHYVLTTGTDLYPWCRAAQYSVTTSGDGQLYVREPMHKIRKHPEQLHMPANTLVRLALTEKFSKAAHARKGESQ